MVNSHSARSRSQSAMEYLMTYGWAILIIAVVLGALFELGVFNSTNFAPKAPPGSCHVFRPDGPGTTQFINLEGLCNGELPQYVATFGISPGGYVEINYTPLFYSSNFTIAVWSSPNPNLVSNPDGTCYHDLVSEGTALQANDIIINGACNVNAVDGWVNRGGTSVRTDRYTYSPHDWYFFVLTYNGVNLDLYSNGTLVEQGGNTIFGPEGYPLFVGSDGPSGGRNFNGSLSNVQIYNTSLSVDQISALYGEGIGGAPMDLRNLVGWWPLNGNADDYSGNNYNGNVIGNVTFTNKWTAGYTQP